MEKLKSLCLSIKLVLTFLEHVQRKDAVFIFNSIIMFRELANVRHVPFKWLIRVNAESERAAKTCSPGRPAALSKLQISSIANHAASREEMWTTLAYNLWGCFLHAWARETQRNPERLKLLFVHTEVSIPCISDWHSPTFLRFICSPRSVNDCYVTANFQSPLFM